MSITTFNATEFKAKCLEILDQVAAHTYERVMVTKHGKPVAVVTAPIATAEAVETLYGFMRGSVVIPDGVDLTAPVLEAPFHAAQGILHR